MRDSFQSLTKALAGEDERIILRALELSDAENCHTNMSFLQTRLFVGRSLPTSLKKTEEWVKKAIDNPQEEVFVVEEKNKLSGFNFVGTMGLHKINPHDGFATSGSCFLPEYWNKGYGKRAKMLLLNVAFNQMRLNSVRSSVLAFNRRSLQHNLNCGYRVMCTLPNARWKNGHWTDEIVLYVLRKWWLPLWDDWKKVHGGLCHVQVNRQ